MRNITKSGFLLVISVDDKFSFSLPPNDEDKVFTPSEDSIWAFLIYLGV